jgi:hypothetical protein
LIARRGIEGEAGELRDRLGDVSVIASAVLEGFVIDPGELFADLD